jgi:RNA polymerase sigma-70 factor (ECF subfamily)
VTVASASAKPVGVALAAPAVRAETPPFAQVYDAHFAFVFRSARRLGVDDRAIDDVVQEAFVVVHRRLGEFEGRSSLKTWIYGILRRSVNDHRRAVRRKNPETGPGQAVDPETIVSDQANPQERAAEAEGVRILYALLDTFDPEMREVFVLAELEQMTVPEIAEALELNVNTVYTRLRAARHHFEKAVVRYRARDVWRSR